MPSAYERLGVEVGYSDPATFTMGNAGTEVRRIDGKRLQSLMRHQDFSTTKRYLNMRESLNDVTEIYELNNRVSVR